MPAIWARFMVLAASLNGVACERAAAPSTSSPAPAASPSTGSLVTAPAISGAKLPAQCREEDTAPLPAPRDYGSLQNVRVAASADGALISWETLNQPALGDTSQVGFAAFLRHRADKPDVISAVALPARAYASAVYTSLAPTRVGSKLDLFAYGVGGAPAFATYAGGSAPWHGLSVFLDVGPEALNTTVLPFAVTESLAVASDFPLALVGGEEAPCESYYECTEQYEPARLKGLTRSLRTLSIANGSPHSEVVYRGTSKLPAKAFVPALAVQRETSVRDLPHRRPARRDLHRPRWQTRTRFHRRVR